MQRYGQREPRQTPSLVSDQELEQIIIEGDANTLVKVAERLGKDFANDLSTSQIRNVFGEVKRLQMRKEFDVYAARELLLLKPKLAYQAGRHGGKVKDLEQILSKAIDRVTDPKHFENFADFFEAILAYHKAHGGK